jgi:hypothetical protein
MNQLTDVGVVEGKSFPLGARLHLVSQSRWPEYQTLPDFLRDRMRLNKIRPAS